MYCNIEATYSCDGFIKDIEDLIKRWALQLSVLLHRRIGVKRSAISSDVYLGGSGGAVPPLKKLTDRELINAVCANNEKAIVYFFYEKFAAVFQYHIFKLFKYRTDVQDLIDEFFLYLYEDDWHKLRTFNGSKASLSTWISVVSFRFFQNYKLSKIDSRGLIAINDKWESFVGDWVESQDAGLEMDINNAIASITNERDREIAQQIFIEDRDFQEIAKEFDLSIDYVYTVKNRLIKLLRTKLCSYH